jgi:mRNA-degrading endonuclease RelE of RelBE toxin-antitoxin system
MREDPFGGDLVRLKGEHSGWRRRVGGYRVFFDVDPARLIVDVVEIARRTSTTY